MTSDREQNLRIGTYLVPDYPLTFFQTVQYYLESVLECTSILAVESRIKGGFKLENNAFVNNWIDLGMFL